MIQFSSVVANILQSPSIEAVQLVNIAGYRSCNYFRDITLSNGELFLADGNLIGADAPQAISHVTKDTYNIVFADPAMVYGGYAEEGLIGRDVIVRLCFIDPATNLPITNLADTLLVYKGRISSTSYQTDLNVMGSSKFTVEASGPISNLERSKAYYTSQGYIKNINPNDAGYDQVYEGSGAVNIRWGK